MRINKKGFVAECIRAWVNLAMQVRKDAIRADDNDFLSGLYRGQAAGYLLAARSLARREVCRLDWPDRFPNGLEVPHVLR